VAVAIIRAPTASTAQVSTWPRVYPIDFLAFARLDGLGLLCDATELMAHSCGLSHSRTVVGALLLLAGVMGCRSQRAAPERNQPASKLIEKSAPSAAATASTASIASADAGQVVPEAVHCKALGKHALASVGSVRDSVVDLLARDASLYVLSFDDRPRRATLTRFRRDGAPPVKLAHHDGVAEPKSFLMTKDAAYFTRKTDVFRVELASGEVKQVVHGLADAIAVFGDDVYGVSCGAGAAGADQLIRASLVNGARESIAELPRVAVNKRASGSPPCDYHYLAVEANTVFISDWAGRRILSVSMADKVMHEVVRSGSYPMRITLEPETIVYQSEGGLYRVPRHGGQAEQLAELANTPFTTYVSDEREFWINQSIAYTENVWIYRLARTAGKPKKVLQFKGYKDCSFPCEITEGIAIDDECVYIAHREEHSVSLFAWPKN
jgi:hypothetical protein